MHRSRSGEKKPRRGSALTPHSHSAGTTIAEGNVQSNNWVKSLNTEHGFNFECGPAEGTNSITLEFKRSHSKKASGMPIKALINEEMTREKHTRRSSPSLIARLMGLDTLPSPGGLKPLKDVRNSSSKVLYNNFHEKVTTIEDCSLQSSDDEHQEFKDVFEVVQVPMVEKHKGRVVKKGMASLRRHEMDKAFIQQSFIDSTDGMLSTCEELVNEEDLDGNTDIYLPFLQEPSKRLHRMTHSPSPPHAISILMASKGSSNAKKTDMHNNFQRDGLQSFRKIAANGRPSREHLRSLLKKLSESSYPERDEYCAQPTQIVILKPSLDKVHKTERTVPPVKKLKFPVDEIMESYNEERDWQNLHHSAEIIGHKMKGSRVISKEFAKPTRKSHPPERKKVSVTKFNDFENDEGSCTTSGIMNWNNSNHSSSCPIESKVTKEARERLSERWKLTNRFQEMGFSNRASNTLAEMLALSDNEAPKVAADTLTVKKIPERKLFIREDYFEHRNHPLGISSKDGWKDDFSRSLPRCKSLPSSFTRENSQWNSRTRPGRRSYRIMHKKVDDVNRWMSLDDGFVKHKSTSYRNLKCSSNKDKIHSDGEENIAIEREIHVSSEKLKISNGLRHLSDSAIDIQSDDSISERRDTTDILSVSLSNTDNCLTDRETEFEMLQNFTKLESSKESFECDRHELASKETLTNGDGDQLPADHCSNSGPICPRNDNDTDQPSPVSVFEASFDEECSISCFEKISADLHELRLQLRLLKHESADCYTEDAEAAPISSDEDAAEESFPEYADILHAFRDEEDRDYSYVLDILIYGDVLNAELEGLSAACHLTEYPVDLHMFNKLEKKYKLIYSWSRPDRKLLFDLTNSILADIIKTKSCWRFKMAHDGLVEKVWQAVVGRRKNLNVGLGENLSGIRCADFGNDKELIGTHLENMIEEGLLVELVDELTPR